MRIRPGIAVAIAALAGCNAVFGLDPTQLAGDDDAGTGTIDAPPTADAVACTNEGTHDEDDDDVTDVCDICPHVVDPEQDDRDGDRVGDACDPGPGAHQIVHFDPLEPAGTDWNLVFGGWFNDPEGFRVVDASMDALAYTTMPLPEGGTVDLGIRIEAVSAPAGGAVSLWYRAALQNMPPEGYACRIANAGAGATQLGLSASTSTQVFSLGTQTLTAPYVVGERIRLRGYHEWNGGALQCDSFQPPVEGHLVSRNTMFAGGQIGVGSTGTALTVEYIVVMAPAVD
jgi:hypothetical protein